MFNVVGWVLMAFAGLIVAVWAFINEPKVSEFIFWRFCWCVEHWWIVASVLFVGGFLFVIWS